jgi:predicted MPP superfamily phosphohydrolase
MDTTPFHLILFALDIAVFGGLFLWIRHRRNDGSPSAVYQFEKSLYTAVPVKQPSCVWDVTGVMLFGGFGFVCFAVFSRLIFTNYFQQHVYYFNTGQCVAEGIAVHGTLFFIVSAALLYWNRRYFCAAFSCCCALFLTGASFNVLYWEPYHLRVEHYTIKTSKVKTQVKIVFVSDIQTDRISSHEINTLKKIQQQNADLIILGGDYIQTFKGTREQQLPEKFRQMLIDYPLTAPLGVYALMGNIRDDKVRDADLFKDTGIEFILDSTVFDNLGADKNLGPIDFIPLGIGDSWGGLDENDLPDSGNFIVMAGHCPNYAVDGWTNPKTGNSLSGYRNAAKAPDLMLAGHTHGGQVIIPFYGPLTLWGDERARQIPHNMWSGFFPYSNGGHLLITRGSGLERGWAPRIRLFCPAEISVITIQPE